MSVICFLDHFCPLSCALLECAIQNKLLLHNIRVISGIILTFPSRYRHVLQTQADWAVIWPIPTPHWVAEHSCGLDPGLCFSVYTEVCIGAAGHRGATRPAYNFHRNQCGGGQRKVVICFVQSALTCPYPLSPTLLFGPCRVSRLLRELFTGLIRLHGPNCVFNSRDMPCNGVHAFRNQHPGDIFTGGHKLQAHCRMSTYFGAKIFDIR